MRLVYATVHVYKSEARSVLSVLLARCLMDWATPPRAAWYTATVVCGLVVSVLCCTHVSEHTEWPDYSLAFSQVEDARWRNVAGPASVQWQFILG